MDPAKSTRAPTPLDIDPEIMPTAGGGYCIVLRISSHLIDNVMIEQTVPIEFASIADAITIANRTIAYFEIHGVAPDFENPQFRHPDHETALSTPPT